MPCLLEISSLKIINTIRLPERRAESEESIVTDSETAVARPTLKKMIAIREGCTRGDQSAAAVSQGVKAIGIRGFKGHDLLRRKTLGPYLIVSFFIPIIPQVQERIKAEVVLGLCPAETGDLRHFLKIRS